MDAWAPICKGEGELKAELARSHHGFISQGLSLKGEGRLEADKESTLEETCREKDLPRDWRDLRREARGLERASWRPGPGCH